MMRLLSNWWVGKITEGMNLVEMLAHQKDRNKKKIKALCNRGKHLKDFRFYTYITLKQKGNILTLEARDIYPIRFIYTEY